jgi:Family of unknown function (DUF5681)
VSEPSDTVGYKRPPRASRWKKGQSGNPGGRRRTHAESAVETIDRRLLRPIVIVESGTRRKVATVEAIILQLWAKEIVGDRRASRALLQYEELARRVRPPGVEIRFVDSDYTRALLPEPPSEGVGDG